MKRYLKGLLLITGVFMVLAQDSYGDDPNFIDLEELEAQAQQQAAEEALLQAVAAAQAAAAAQTELLGHALIEAASQGNLHDLLHVIELGAFVDFRGANGNTALHFAIMRGDPGIVSVLLDRSANVFIRNRNHKNAMNLAEDGENAEIIQMVRAVFTQPPPVLDLDLSSSDSE